MNRIVVDASIAVMWFAHEPKSSIAAGLLGTDYELHAPQLMLIETANALRKKALQRDVAAANITPALDRLRTIGLTWTPDWAIVIRAARLSVTLRHPVYDCLYLVLAQEQGAVLATDDHKLAALARKLRPAVPVWQGLN